MTTAALPRRARLGMRVKATSLGVVIDGVHPGGAAEAAGLQAGDVVEAIDGQPVGDVQELTARLRGLFGGSAVRLSVARDGGAVEVAVAPRAVPTEVFADATVHLGQITSGGIRHRTLRTRPGRPCHGTAYLLLGADGGSCEHPDDPGHPVRELVAGLSAAGFETLRLERSGVGDSEGPACTEVDFATELASHREALHSVTSVPGEPVSLIGLSLGGMVAPLLAAGQPAVRSVIVFGTSARPWHDCVLDAGCRAAELAGMTGDELTRFRSELEALQTLVYRDGLSPDRARQLHPELAQVGLDWYRGQRVNGRIARFFQQLQAIDLRCAWQAVAAPVLAVHGEHDWITARLDAQQIAELAPRGRALELAGVDHQMRRCTSVAESLGTRGAFAAELVSECVTWMQGAASDG